MKALKIFIVLCFIAALTANNVYAQNRVVKEDVTIDICGWFCPCTGDYLCGTNTFELLTSSNNEIARLKDGILYGYNENGKFSGRVYEYSQLSPGTYSEESPTGIKWYENDVRFRIEGKLIAEAHYAYRFTTNGKDEIIFERSAEKWNCK